jgi:hypothetical protein
VNVRTLRSRAFAAFCTFVVASSFAGTGDKSQNRYPNELEGFRFYAEHLAPLEPGLSGEKAVRRVLGDTSGVRRNGWTINTTYAAKGGSAYNRTLGLLAEIILRPDAIVPMAAVKFPPRFAQCHSSLSEFNISFDVYSDTSGLEYWLHEEDSIWGKKGDLFQIVYGPKRKPFLPNTIC